jgi:hypothetical protein
MLVQLSHKSLAQFNSGHGSLSPREKTGDKSGQGTKTAANSPGQNGPFLTANGQVLAISCHFLFEQIRGWPSLIT